MDKFKPQGSKLLVEPIERSNFVGSSGIEVVNLTLSYGKVVEIPPMFEGVYAKGDLVCYPTNAGYSQLYNGVTCLRCVS